MGLIHEELYKGDKIDTLDFAAYLRKLTADLFGSYNLGNKDIGFKLDLDQIYLDGYCNTSWNHRKRAGFKFF